MQVLRLLKILLSFFVLFVIVCLGGQHRVWIGEKAEEFVVWVDSSGWIGIVGLIVTHSIAVALCFPATIVFEWGAGFTFGVLKGSLIVAMSKTLGGILGFTLGKTLFREWAVAAVKSSPRWSFVFDSIGEDGLYFAFLLRLSPVPSWVNNYGLALTPLSYPKFLIATLFGSLPFIVSNVWTGSMAHSVTALAGGTTNAETSTVKTVLITMGGLSMLLISQQLLKLLTAKIPAQVEQSNPKKTD